MNSPQRLLLLPAMAQAVGSLCLLLPLSGAAIMPAAADAPFAPIDKVPDYVVTMAERRFQSEEARPRIVRHHGNWTRVDSVNLPFGTDARYDIAAYFSTDRKTEIRVYRTDLRVQMVRGDEPSPLRDTAPRNTGERQSHLGESCTVWDAWRVASGPTGGLTHLSCITDDGIELWHKSVGQHGVLGSAEAIRIERRAVAPEEVQPIPRLLVPDWWADDLSGNLGGDVGGATAPATPDHEAVMMLDSGTAVRTTRRHGPWQSVEQTSNGVRKLRVTHSDLNQAALEYTSDNSGTPKQHLSILRPAPVPGNAALRGSTQAVDLNRTETVLGETCRWFNMWPGSDDGGLQTCLTDDGILLKESRVHIGSMTVWTAVRLVRRPVSLDEIRNPDVLRDAQAWGVQ